MRAALWLACAALAGCAGRAIPVAATPPDLGPPPAAPAWPALAPRACGGDVCLTPEEAIAIGGWRDRIEAWGAEMLTRDGYWRGEWAGPR